MLEKFKKYLVSHCKCNLKDNFLLAISGGVDSVVMACLFQDLSISFGIVHCNFQLRGEDSKKDLQFVEQLGHSYQVPFFTKEFDAEKIAKQQKVSVEMAARKLRYQWFEIIRNENSYNYIATAHHANDVAETMLINLIRGTGIKGLEGIPAKNNYIIRPLLFFTKYEICHFAKKKKLKYRKDQSNHDTKIYRNYVRHIVLPSIKKLNPAIIHTLNKTSSRFKKINTIYKKELQEFCDIVMKKQQEDYIFDIEKIKTFPTIDCYLYETVKKFGFNYRQVLSVINSFTSTAGKIFYSKNYSLLKDRTFLIIKQRVNNTKEEYILHSFMDEISFQSLTLKFKHIQGIDYKNNKDENTAFVDAKKLKFPLLTRKWKKADKFYPLGMKKQKKISDFFIDNKFSLFEKEKIWLLISDNKIVWIIGKRLDNRYKVEKNTVKIYKITATYK